MTRTRILASALAMVGAGALMGCDAKQVEQYVAHVNAVLDGDAERQSDATRPSGSVVIHPDVDFGDDPATPPVESDPSQPPVDTAPVGGGPIYGTAPPTTLPEGAYDPGDGTAPVYSPVVPVIYDGSRCVPGDIPGVDC